MVLVFYSVGGVVFLLGSARVVDWLFLVGLPVLGVYQVYFANVALRLRLARVATPCIWNV